MEDVKGLINTIDLILEDMEIAIREGEVTKAVRCLLETRRIIKNWRENDGYQDKGEVG